MARRGEVDILVPPQEGESAQSGAKKALARLTEHGLEACEIRDGARIHMSADDAEKVAGILAELGLRENNVNNFLSAAINREPAEALQNAIRAITELHLRESERPR